MDKVTNLLQIPKYFDLDIYTTGRLEKVCQLFVDGSSSCKLGSVSLKLCYVPSTFHLAFGCLVAANLGGPGQAYRH